MSEETERATDEVEKKVSTLADKWGYVEISVNPNYDRNLVTVRNHTDEGLGADERLWTRGDSLEEALDYALNGDTVSSYQEDSPWDTSSDEESETDE